MTNNLKTILFIGLSIYLFASCKKKTNNNDTQNPVITIAEPTMNDTISLSTTPEVHVEFTVTDETGLHNLQVFLIKNNSDTLLNESPSVNNLKVFLFHEHIVPTGITSNTPFKAVMIAKDHLENTTQKIIDFTVTP